MKFEKISSGQYRAELYNRVGEYVWVVRKGHRKWVWYVGTYDGNNLYFSWEKHDEDYEGTFPSLRKAIADAINRLLNPSNYKYF